MRTRVAWVLVSMLLLGSGCAVLAQDSDVPKSLISTGITGSVAASGLNNPQYVLSFIPVQRLMLAATQRPLTATEIEKAVQGTPVSLDNLLRLQLLRKENDTYRLNYLVLTVHDQELLYQTSARYGQSLADAFRQHQAEFKQILLSYPDANLRPELLFDLIAGIALNWRGLELTTELGYRVQEPVRATGGTYLVHSAENGAHLDFTGLYFDSQSVPGSKMSFATFGDGGSLPRLQGLPDAFDGMDAAMEDWREMPEIYAALRSEYLTLFLVAIDDAGQIMAAVANGTDTDAALAKELALSEQRRLAMLHLLKSLGYLREKGGRLVAGVALLTTRDKAMVDATLNLSREIMTGWLRRNYPTMKDELADLSPMKNGVPFAEAFNEAWHYTFGFAARSLAETGFYANPRGAQSRFAGYAPLVWETPVIKGPRG